MTRAIWAALTDSHLAWACSCALLAIIALALILRLDARRNRLGRPRGGARYLSLVRHRYDRPRSVHPFDAGRTGFLEHRRDRHARPRPDRHPRGSALVYATLTVPGVILAESFISLLGLGVQEPDTSWGVLISDGAQTMEPAPWALIFPALLLGVTVGCCNMLGDRLRDQVDALTSGRAKPPR